MKMKVEVWRTGYGRRAILEHSPSGHAYLQGEGWVRTSEPVEVEFPEREKEAVLGEQLQALDVKEEALREEHAKQLDLIRQARDALRQLTFDNAAHVVDDLGGMTGDELSGGQS